jgi:metallophosphoesterase (TIGR00282 family)
LGNHAFKDRDVFALLSDYDNIVRPANYPYGAPGKGTAVFYTKRGAVAVVNLLGRLYMEACDCPFAAAENEISRLRGVTNMIILDMHAEATSEKRAMACHVDGSCSFVAGTHTHVQTADEQILPLGTAFITDVGMTGPADGVIGVKSDAAIRRFRTLIPERYAPAEGRAQINAVIADIDEASGKANSIVRINEHAAIG